MSTCPLCNEEHDQPFTPEELAIHEQFREAQETGERIDALVDLVELYSDRFDPSDLTWPEEVHNMLHELDDARARVQQIELHLGRALARSITAYLAEHAEAHPTAPKQLPTAVAKGPKGPKRPVN